MTSRLYVPHPTRPLRWKRDTHGSWGRESKWALLNGSFREVGMVDGGGISGPRITSRGVGQILVLLVVLFLMSPSILLP